MARLLIDGEWYESLASSSYYESDFEAILLEHATTLYPEYWMVPFKTLLQSEHGVSKPDFALIERRYRSWWVVEIELAHHPLSHVMRQVEVFAAATFGLEEAAYLATRDPSLDRPALEAMLRGAPPEVLVIVNAPSPAWEAPLKQFGASLAVAEVFRSGRNHHVLRVNGAYPSAVPNVISLVRLDPLMPRLVVVDSPANLPPPTDGRFHIDYQGSVTEWEAIQTATRVWLNPVRTNPLPTGVRFALVRGDAGHLALTPVP